MENPGMRDVHGRQVLFQVLQTNICMQHNGFHRVYFRDCTDCGTHPVPLTTEKKVLAERCVTESAEWCASLDATGSATWVTHHGYWVELRIEESVCLAFIWDRHTTPRPGVSKTTYVTERYWNSWQYVMTEQRQPSRKMRKC